MSFSKEVSPVGAGDKKVVGLDMMGSLLERVKEIERMNPAQQKVAKNDLKQRIGHAWITILDDVSELTSRLPFEDYELNEIGGGRGYFGRSPKVLLPR